MGNIAQKIEELVGRTPLLEVRGIEKEKDLKAKLLVKLELFNPAGSVKDRTALSMIQDGEENGLLGPGSVKRKYGDRSCFHRGVQGLPGDLYDAGDYEYRTAETFKRIRGGNHSDTGSERDERSH